MNRTFLSLVLIASLSAVLTARMPDEWAGFTAVQDPGSRSWRLLEELTLTDVEGSWVNHELAHNYFSQSHPDLVDSTSYSYFEASAGWLQGGSDHFSYNAAQDRITEIVTCLDAFTESIPMARSLYEYDQANRLTAARLQSSGLDRTWFDVKRAWVSYDNGALSQIMIYDSSLVDYPPTWNKWELQFDYNGRINLLTEYNSEDSLNWILSFRTSFCYHASDTTTGAGLVELVSRRFPGFLHYGRPLEVGRLSEQVREIWMYQYWRNEARNTYVYDYADRLIIDQSYYNNIMGDWVFDIVHTFAYDCNGNCESRLTQAWNEDPPAWLNESIVCYTWEQSTANGEETLPAAGQFQVTAYPNPFRSSLSVAVSSKAAAPVRLELYNVKGQKLFSCSALPGRKLVLSDEALKAMPAAGIYFLRAEQDGRKVTSKLLKLR